MWFFNHDQQGEESPQGSDASLNRQGTIALAVATQGEVTYASTLGRGGTSYVFADSRTAQHLGKLPGASGNTYTVKEIAQIPSHFLAQNEALKLLAKDGNLALAEDGTIQTIKSEAPKAVSPSEADVFRNVNAAVIDARTKSLLEAGKAPDGSQVIQTLQPNLTQTQAVNLGHTVSPPIAVEQQSLNLSQTVAHTLGEAVQQESFQAIQQPVMVAPQAVNKPAPLVTTTGSAAAQNKPIQSTATESKGKGSKPSRWNDMLNILLEENWALKMELKQCQKKLGKLQRKLRGQSDKKNLVTLKRYVKVAGIQIKNWDRYFWDCPCQTDKIQKLLDLFEERGVKGPPTMEKCRKLRKKTDRRKEVDELVNCKVKPDMIDADPPSMRTRRKTAATREQDMEQVKRERERENFEACKARFSRLRNIVDSESDEDDEMYGGSTSTGQDHDLDFHADLESAEEEGALMDGGSMSNDSMPVPNSDHMNMDGGECSNGALHENSVLAGNMLVDSDDDTPNLTSAPRIKVLADTDDEL